MSNKVILMLVLLVMLALLVTGCDGDCEVICCKMVEYWWGSSRSACKAVSNDTCSCPSGWTMTSVISYPDNE